MDDLRIKALFGGVLALFLAILALIFDLNAGLLEARADSKPFGVAVTIPPQGYFVSRIGGDLVSVEAMMPANADHETYEPSMAQLSRLNNARLYFRIGHPAFVFESNWLGKLLQETGGKQLAVVDMFAPADFITGDIHIWLSFNGGRGMARSVLTELSKVDPAHSAQFEQNYNGLIGDIDQLEAAVKSGLSWRKRNSLIVYHPAWGYLCRELGLNQLAIENDGKEPSPMTLAKILAAAKAEGITKVFADGHAPKASLDLIASEIHGDVVILDPLEPDWLGNMKKITTAITKALN